MVTVILFVAYLVLFSFIITRLRFFTRSGISKKWLLALFIFKVFAGLCYGMFYGLPQYKELSDTYALFNMGCKETDWLLQHPVDFVKDLFVSGYKERGNLFVGRDSYWNDLKDNVVIKLIAVINLFTGKRYFVNIIFFNFFFFFGPVALFRLLYERYQEKKKILLFTVFLIPSFLFWCSGLHKDGFVFAAITISAYYFNRLLMNKKLSVKQGLLLLISFAALFMLRNFLFFLLFTGLIAWYLAHRFPQKQWLCFIGVYVFAIAVFFTAGYIHPSVDFPAYIVNKQSEFKQLSGQSAIPVPLLHPSLQGFLQFFPYALDVCLLRPHLTDSSSISYLAAGIENIMVLIFIVFSIVVRGKKKLAPVLLFCMFYSFSILLLTGYTITFSAAVVRYKSIILPLLIAALAVRLPINIFKKKWLK